MHVNTGFRVTLTQADISCLNLISLNNLVSCVCVHIMSVTNPLATQVSLKLYIKKYRGGTSERLANRLAVLPCPHAVM